MRLLSVKEVARILNVPQGRVYVLVQRGVIPHVRLGTRQIRVPEDALRKWLENAVRGGGVQ